MLEAIPCLHEHVSRARYGPRKYFEHEILERVLSDDFLEVPVFRHCRVMDVEDEAVVTHFSGVDSKCRKQDFAE